jgi:transcriptional regulator PpsR
MSRISVAQPDITLFLDMEGVIQTVTVSDNLSAEGVQSWTGRRWIDTVADVGGSKVRRMLEDARRDGVSAYRQVNQRFPNGLELPIEYTTVRLGDKAGLIAIGRNLQAVAELQSRLIAAQQAMEQDYWKLREVETRYRMLFDASNEAVLLIRADTLRIVDANPAAIRTLGLAKGRELLPELAPHELAPFQAMLARVRDQGRGPGVLVHLGAEAAPWTIRASLMTADPGPVFLLQLVPVGGSALRLVGGTDVGDPVSIEALIDRLPDGFVIVDEAGVIRRANRGFLDLVQMGAEGAVIGERLGRWLSRPGADMNVLRASLERHGVVRRFTTTLHGDLGVDLNVEISAAGNAEAGHPYVGVMIRDVSRRLPSSGSGGGDTVNGLRAALSAIIEQSGKTSLPKLVRDTVGVVERHCIDAALELTDGNRTAAAELLGLSRQSLYEKLNRYEIDGLGKEHAPRSGMAHDA